MKIYINALGVVLLALQATTTTYYPNKYYNINSNGEITKHIFVGDIDIATVRSCKPPTGGDWTVNGDCTLATSTNLDSLTIGPGGVVTLSSSPAKPPATITYNHPDHLGGTTVTTNASGSIQEITDYYPYGEIRFDQSSKIPEQRKFTGHEYDPVTGYTYMKSRYYDGSTGRFLSQDPMFWQLPQELLLDPQLQNSYSYARNNPIINTDPSGDIAVGDALKATNQWLKSLFNNTAKVTSNILQYVGGGESKGNEKTVLSPNAWKSQMPDLTGCLRACISMAKYSPTSQINTATLDSSGKIKVGPNAAKGVATINQYLRDGIPIIVGVNRGTGGSQSSNLNPASEHFVIINGSGYDSKGKYYTFLDPGTKWSEKGASPNNKLYLGRDNSLSGTTAYNNAHYLVTEVKLK